MAGVIIQWEQLDCGNVKINNWLAKVVSPVETVYFAAVFKTIHGLWRVNFSPKGRAIDRPSVCIDYPSGKDKAMADVEKWGRAHWRTLPLWESQFQPQRW